MFVGNNSVDTLLNSTDGMKGPPSVIWDDIQGLTQIITPSSPLGL